LAAFRDCTYGLARGLYLEDLWVRFSSYVRPLRFARVSTDGKDANKLNLIRTGPFIYVRQSARLEKLSRPASQNRVQTVKSAR